MAAWQFSSGEPRLDRRAAFAEALAAEGDWAEAIEVLSGVMEEAPDWAAGWFRLGELFEAAGRTTDAARVWERAVSLDPSDPFGAGLKRDLLRAEPLAETLPAAFVETLFDQYAPRFEAALVEDLAYCGPELIAAGLRRSGFRQARRAIDLGCGTGLTGVALRPISDWLDGVDLSGGMLAEARRKGLYDRLQQADISALALGPEPYDLIVAADVFAYLGALEPVIGWCAAMLSPGGRLAFTVEATDSPGFVLRDSRRFAHSRAYLSDLLATAGFSAVDITPCVVREDRGAGIDSFCVVAAAPDRRLADREGEGDAALA